MDGTYRCKPYNINGIKVLILLICYNEKKGLYELCLEATFSHEDKDIYMS